MKVQSLLAYVQGYAAKAWREGAAVVAIIVTFDPSTGLIEGRKYRFTTMAEAQAVLEELA